MIKHKQKSRRRLPFPANWCAVFVIAEVQFALVLDSSTLAEVDTAKEVSHQGHYCLPE